MARFNLISIGALKVSSADMDVHEVKDPSGQKVGDEKARANRQDVAIKLARQRALDEEHRRIAAQTFRSPVIREVQVKEPPAKEGTARGPVGR
jgi:hypothetical protein